MSSSLKKMILMICEEILGEPDQSQECARNNDDEENPKDEQNTVASVAPGGMGPVMPLGAGPAYPADQKNKKKKKKPEEGDENWYKTRK